MDDMMFFKNKVKRRIALLKKYANKGNAKAQFHLGVMYFMGEGVEQSYNTALEWFTLSADKGNADARFFLSEMIASGFQIDNRLLRSRCANRKRCEGRTRSRNYLTMLKLNKIF